MDSKVDLINKIIEIQDALYQILNLNTTLNTSTRIKFYSNYTMNRLEQIYEDLLKQMARLVSR
jgi:hypothetical protein